MLYMDAFFSLKVYHFTLNIFEEKYFVFRKIIGLIHVQLCFIKDANTVCNNLGYLLLSFYPGNVKNRCNA